MGALPKNKITRVERGKRRHGNTPKLIKDAHATVPAHKQGFMHEFLHFLGLEHDHDAHAPKAEKAAEPAKAKKAASTQANVAKTTTVKPAKRTATKTVRKAQHKG